MDTEPKRYIINTNYDGLWAFVFLEKNELNVEQFLARGNFFNILLSDRLLLLYISVAFQRLRSFK